MREARASSRPIADCRHHERLEDARHAAPQSGCAVGTMRGIGGTLWLGPIRHFGFGDWHRAQILLERPVWSPSYLSRQPAQWERRGEAPSPLANIQALICWAYCRAL